MREGGRGPWLAPIEDMQLVEVAELKKPGGARTLPGIQRDAVLTSVIERGGQITYPSIKVAAYDSGVLGGQVAKELGQGGPRFLLVQALSGEGASRGEINVYKVGSTPVREGNLRPNSILCGFGGQEL